MKKIYTFLAGFVLLSSVFFASCTAETALKVGENVEPQTPVTEDSIITPNDRSGLRHQLRELRTPEIIINVEAGHDEIKVGQRGTIFHFYPNSFKDANGQLITDGFIELKIIEIYDLGQMIANRLTTQDNNGKLLESRGMMRISATKNGVPVYANKYAIFFKQDMASGQAMSTYHGSYAGNDSAMVWTLQPNATGNNAISTTNINGNEYYVIDSCSVFGSWINLAAEHVQTQPLTGVFTLSMPSTDFNLSNTEVYVIYDDVKSLVTMANYNSRIPAFLTDEQIPLDRTFNIIVVARGNTEEDIYFYFRKDDILMSQMLMIPASPVQVNKQTLLNNLNVYE
jgi:hypothetical protein